MGLMVGENGFNLSKRSSFIRLERIAFSQRDGLPASSMKVVGALRFDLESNKGFTS